MNSGLRTWRIGPASMTTATIAVRTYQTLGERRDRTPVAQGEGWSWADSIVRGRAA